MGAWTEIESTVVFITFPQAILKIYLRMKKTKTNKVAKAGCMIMTASLNCIGLYIFTVRYYPIILASPCKINIWLKTSKLYSFFWFNCRRFSYDFLSFVTLHVKPHKTWEMIDRNSRNYLVTYFEDKKWRYASWEMTWFTAGAFDWEIPI